MSKQLSKNILQPPYNFNEVWEELLESKDFVKVFLSEVLEAYILKQRWYGGKASKLKYIELSEYFKIKQGDEVYYGLILEINFFEAYEQCLASLTVSIITPNRIGEYGAKALFFEKENRKLK